jgi:prolipoprotein diacylglyceryltransferase
MTRGWLSDDATRSLAVHPTQLYFASVGLVILVIALGWRHLQRHSGETWLLALAAWGFANPIVESFRDPSYLTGAPHLGASGFLIGAAAFTGFLFWRFAPLSGVEASARGAQPSAAGGPTLS